MLKNKLTMLVLAIVVFSLKAVAIDSNFKNSLDEIYIKKTSGNNYSVNFLFNKEYTEPLSLQKKGPTTYSIILPETKLSSKNIKIVYKDGNDSIKLTVNEYPYIDQTINNGYVKVTASVKNNAKLNVSTDVTASKAKDIQNVPKSAVKTQTAKTKVPTLPVEKKEPVAKTQPEAVPQNLPEEPAQPTYQETNSASETNQSKEDLEIMRGLTSVDESLAEKIQPEDKPPINKDYLSIMMNISLFLLIMLLLTRYFYKKYKIKTARTVEREELKQNYRKRLDGSNEENPTEDYLENIYPEPTTKSAFQQQVESMSLTAEQKNVATKSQENIQEAYSNIPTLTEEEDYLDENFDYEIIEAPEDIETTYAPKLLSEAKIDNNKGFYLIQYDGEIALVGYIGDNYFVINKFNKIFKPNLQTRLHERQETYCNYLVRVDSYKALIQVSKTNMKVLIEF